MLALALVLMGCVASQAEPSANPGPLQSVGWWMDKAPSGERADLVQVQQLDGWQTFHGWKSMGYGAEPVWFRLRLSGAEANEQTAWIVHIRPAFLDQLTLYDPVAGLTLRGGDFFPPDDDALGSIGFSFQIPALVDARDVYLRMESTGARTIHIDVLPLPEAQRRTRLSEWLFGFVTALSTIFAMWASLQWWYSRDRLIGIFAVKQAFATLWAFFILGFARITIGDWLLPGVLSGFTSLAISWAIGSIIWFMVALFDEYQPRPFLRRLMCGLALLFAVLPLLQLLGMTREALMIINALIPPVLIVMLVTLATAKGADVKPAIARGWLFGYLCIYGAMNMIPPLMHLGLLPETPIVFFGNLAQVVMDGMVMLVILQLRAKTLEQRRQETEKALLKSQEQARLERQHREEQGQLLAMLAHEMKTPLATLRMWMDAGPIKRETMERTITDMSEVIERCVHTGQLSDQGLQPERQAVQAADITHAVVRACRAPERVDVDVQGPVPLLNTDPQMLSIVLANLLDNACKYSAPGSRITMALRACLEGGQTGCCWEIRNAVGQAGWPDVDKLFCKYHRGNHARRQSGSGLGLFLVKGLLTLLGGTVRYQAQGQDAVFRLWLPA